MARVSDLDLSRLTRSAAWGCMVTVVEQTGLSVYHLETQAFLAATLDMDSLDLAALYTLH